MNLAKNFLFLPLTVLGLLAALPAQAADPLKIGILLPLTGTLASDGNRLLKANQLAVTQINAANLPGLPGGKVELVVADTQSKPEIARSEAERLISREKVSIVVGGYSSASVLPATQVVERYRVPFIVTSATADAITERGLQFVFHVAPKGSWSARDIANFIEYLNTKKGQNIDKVALAYEDGPFGQSVSKAYKDLLPSRGLQIVAEESFRTGSPDLSTQAAKLKASGAKLVLIVCYVDDESMLLRALAAQQYRPYVLGYGGGHVHPTLLKLGDVAEGSFGVVEWMADMQKPASKAFAGAFTAAYGTAPLSNSAQAYAATWAAALAASEVKGADPVAIRDALRKISIKDGPASLLPNNALAFDKDGQNQIGTVMTQVIGNKFVTVWPEAFAADQVKLAK
ncbi:MAG: ABC transporter substrate-binding protein [Desulfovibrionaceae bacterium]|jgi:branched-chain amino acid transport system substrate-binding protein|nr:ABC transporter substrate-binding protein [Desulfovibrionaceae bacterium]